MIFHGREEELKTLKAFYEAPGSNFKGMTTDP